MYVHSADPQYPWQNKAESVIKIIKGKSKRMRVQRNTLNMVCDFWMVWEADIYYQNTVNDGWSWLERLTGDGVFQTKTSCSLSSSGIQQNSLLIVGIVPIRDKEI